MPHTKRSRSRPIKLVLGGRERHIGRGSLMRLQSSADFSLKQIGPHKFEVVGLAESSSLLSVSSLWARILECVGYKIPDARTYRSARRKVRSEKLGASTATPDRYTMVEVVRDGKKQLVQVDVFSRASALGRPPASPVPMSPSRLEVLPTPRPAPHCAGADSSAPAFSCAGAASENLQRAESEESMYPNLLYALTLRGLLAYQLAAQVRMSESRFSRCARGRMPFTPEERARIVEALNFPDDWLFARPTPPRARSAEVLALHSAPGIIAAR